MLKEMSKGERKGWTLKDLYEARWNSIISCIANKRKHLRDINKEKKIPITEDILKLEQYVQKEIKEIVDNNSPLSSSYQELKGMID